MRHFLAILFTTALSCWATEVQASCGSATCPLNTSRFLRAGLLQVRLSYEYINQDRIYVGSTGEFPQNTGGTYVFISPGLRFQLIDALSGYVFGELPICQNVNGIQQTAQYNVQVGLEADVGLID